MAEKVFDLSRKLGPRVCVLVCCGAASCGGKVADSTPPGNGGETPGNTALPRPAGTSAAGPSSNAGEPGLRGGLQETCDDNPLLAMCQTPDPAPALALPAPSSAPAAGSADPRTLVRVEFVLTERCGNCHGGQPSAERCGTCDGMYYVENLRRLIESGYVVPCDWQGSSLYRRIADGSMPPAVSGQSGLTPRELSLVGNFVDGLCSELSAGGPEDSQRADLESWLGADCGSCHGPASDASAPAPHAVDGVGDIAELLAAGLIVPCDAEGSELVQVLRDASMPPPGVSAHRPQRSQLRTLIAFIDRPCSRR